MATRLSATWCLTPNVGDALTPWLVQKLDGRPAVWVSPGTDIEHFVVTGSVLNWTSRHSIVWGAGLASWKDEVTPAGQFKAVRGPLSLMRLRSMGWRGTAVLGDPALLLPLLVEPSQKHNRIGVVPHYVDMQRFAEGRFEKEGFEVIDPLLPVEEFARQVSACGRIYSSSLHGLIVADAYGVPNQWVKFGDGIGGDGMKYWDYLASVERAATSGPPDFLDYRLAGNDEVVKKLGDATYGLAPADLVRELQRGLVATCPFRRRAL